MRNRDGVTIAGELEVIVRDRDGTCSRRVLRNLVTQVGDQYYGERAAGVASPPAQVTGMQLGTGNTATAKTGAGSAIATYLVGSDQGLDVDYPTSTLEGTKRRITWQATWPAGTFDGATALAEVVLVNRTLDGSAATEQQTIARALISPTETPTSTQEVTVRWHHDLLGA